MRSMLGVQCWIFLYCSKFPWPIDRCPLKLSNPPWPIARCPTCWIFLSSLTSSNVMLDRSMFYSLVSIKLAVATFLFPGHAMVCPGRAGRRTTTRLGPSPTRLPTDDYRSILHNADDGFSSGSTARIGGMGRGVVCCRTGRRRVLLNRPPPCLGARRPNRCTPSSVLKR